MKLITIYRFLGIVFEIFDSTLEGLNANDFKI